MTIAAIGVGMIGAEIIGGTIGVGITGATTGIATVTV
jgi:hypothetical protein